MQHYCSILVFCYVICSCSIHCNSSEYLHRWHIISFWTHTSMILDTCKFHSTIPYILDTYKLLVPSGHSGHLTRYRPSPSRHRAFVSWSPMLQFTTSSFSPDHQCCSSQISLLPPSLTPTKFSHRKNFSMKHSVLVNQILVANIES